MGFVSAIPAALAALPLEPGEELLPFSDYSPEFRIDAQAHNPRVKVFDLRRLDDWKTPAEEFFTFHQTSQPTPPDLADWRLRITGFVENPASLTFEDLRRLPVVEAAVTVECSGNSGHSTLMNGLVSNGVWRGYSLSSLLRTCGVKQEAREVVFFGADTEREGKWPASGKQFSVPHGRSLFVQDALDEKVMLTTHLNGAPLSQAQGFPLRLIVPGWYGMTQVKWLHQIVVLDRRYEGQHMARNYHSVRQSEDSEAPLVLETSISRARLKSVVARVTRKSGSGQHAYTISGAAWGGVHPVARVEVRVNERAWRTAEIHASGGEYAWSLWRLPWPEAVAGTHTIVSRAIDAEGNMQPAREERGQTQLSAREDNSQWPRRIVIS
ncbi:MAG: molybdopterin-dependent oxidoreductase [Bryobacterales bacterium]|nr:molybdopterin-dependent oxidoreductase [Bryobacterales bacterium]